MNGEKFRQPGTPELSLVPTSGNGCHISHVTVRIPQGEWKIFMPRGYGSGRILCLENPQSSFTIRLTENSLRALARLLSETGYMPPSSPPDVGG